MERARQRRARLAQDGWGNAMSESDIPLPPGVVRLRLGERLALDLRASSIRAIYPCMDARGGSLVKLAFYEHHAMDDAADLMRRWHDALAFLMAQRPRDKAKAAG